MRINIKNLIEFMTTKVPQDKGTVDYAVLVCIKFAIVIVPISIIYLLIDILV